MKTPKEIKDWYAKIGRKGGKKTSAAKAKAARKNGKLRVKKVKRYKKKLVAFVEGVDGGDV